MSPSIETMSLRDFNQVIRLWANTEGVGLNESDTRLCIKQFLSRNRGMSFVARDQNEIVGAVLCGHDGRRGYLHHLAVAKTHRKQGLGKKLVETSLAQLERAGILKCNIFLYANNTEGEAFWKHQGWKARADLLAMQKSIANSSEAAAAEYPLI